MIYRRQPEARRRRYFEKCVVYIQHAILTFPLTYISSTAARTSGITSPSMPTVRWMLSCLDAFSAERPAFATRRHIGGAADDERKELFRAGGGMIAVATARDRRARPKQHAAWAARSSSRKGRQFSSPRRCYIITTYRSERGLVKEVGIGDRLLYAGQRAVAVTTYDIDFLLAKAENFSRSTRPNASHERAPHRLSAALTSRQAARPSRHVSSRAILDAVAGPPGCSHAGTFTLSSSRMRCDALRSRLSKLPFEP